MRTPSSAAFVDFLRFQKEATAGPDEAGDRFASM